MARVFISYAHSSDARIARVTRLAASLKDAGLDVTFDRDVPTPQGPPEGWTSWMLNQMEAADWVLVVCDETYYRRFRGQEKPGTGLGVAWEAAVLSDALYAEGGRNEKFVPVVFERKSARWIPERLRGFTAHLLPDELPSLVAKLGGEQKAESPPAKKKRPWIAAAIAAVVLALAIALWFVWPPSPRTAVAVLSFRNDSGQAEAAWLSTALAEVMAHTLSAGAGVRVISREETTRAERDVAGKRIGKRLDADSLVVGTYSLLGDPGAGLLRLEVQLLDAADRKVIATSSATGTETQIADVTFRAAAPIREKLGMNALTPAQSIEVQASVPSTHEAVRLYAMGLSRLCLLDATNAREILTRAVGADGTHPLIRAALSAAYSALGRNNEAHEQSRHALASSTKLSWEQRTRIAAEFHETGNDWEKAITAKKALWDSARDVVEYGVALAETKISAGKPYEALVTIEELRKSNDDATIDLVESRAHQELGDFRKQKTFATSAAAKARVTNDRLLIARARMLEATALLSLGEADGATTAAGEARALFGKLGDRGNTARALELIAASVGSGGDLVSEQNLLGHALAIHRQNGDTNSIARVQLNIGYTLVRQGRVAEAQKSFDDALATFREVGEKYAAAVALNNIGALMFHRGDLLIAEHRYREALGFFSALPEQSGIATTLTNIAEVLAVRGDLENARKMYEEALTMYRTIGDQSGAAYALFRIGELFALRDDRIAARRKFEEALKTQNAIDEPLAAAESKLALAGLSLDEGKAGEAEKAAREAEEMLRTGGAEDRSVLALATIVHALLAQGKKREATEVAERAWQSVAPSEDRRVRFTVAIARARTQDVDAALRFLEPMRLDAAQSHFVVSELEIGMAMGEIEAAARRPGGRQRLAEIENRAKAKGLGSIARRAAAARNRIT